MARHLLPKRYFEDLPVSFQTLFDKDLLEFSSETSGLEICEDNKNVYVKALLPDLSEKDIHVTIENGTLWIKGEKKEEEQNKEKQYYCRSQRSFSYHMTLPPNIDKNAEPTSAILENGALNLSFCKICKSEPKKINITKKK